MRYKSLHILSFFLFLFFIPQKISNIFFIISDDHTNQQEQEQVIKIGDNRLHHVRGL